MDVSLIELESDHPGFNDPVYRARRNEIAALAQTHRAGKTIPLVNYTEIENATWAEVHDGLVSLHATHACHEFNDDLHCARVSC